MLALEEGDLAARRAELWQMSGEVHGLARSCCRSVFVLGCTHLPSATRCLSDCMSSTLSPCSTLLPHMLLMIQTGHS